MYRTIFIPTAYNSTVPFTIPEEWYGKEIEFTVSPIEHKEKKKTKGEEILMKLSGAWESDKSAEEMAFEMRTARKFTKRDLVL